MSYEQCEEIKELKRELLDVLYMVDESMVMDEVMNYVKDRRIGLSYELYGKQREG